MLESEKFSVENTLNSNVTEVTQKPVLKPAKPNTAIKILIGIGISFVVWVLGILLSGELPIIVDYISFGGSVLFYVYPLIVAVVFIITSVKCARKGYGAILLSLLISFIIPILCFIIWILIEKNASGEFAGISAILYLICSVIGAPAISVEVSLFSWFQEYDGIKLFLLEIAYCIPAIIGAIASVVIYAKKKVNKN